MVKNKFYPISKTTVNYQEYSTNNVQFESPQWYICIKNARPPYLYRKIRIYLRICEVSCTVSIPQNNHLRFYQLKCCYKHCLWVTHMGYIWVTYTGPRPRPTVQNNYFGISDWRPLITTWGGFGFIAAGLMLSSLFGESYMATGSL